VGSGRGECVGGRRVDPRALALGWRACFLVNVPVGLLALAASRGSVGERATGAAARIDRGGAVIVFVGLVALLAPVIEGRRLGWPGGLDVSVLAGTAPLGGVGVRQRGP